MTVLIDADGCPVVDITVRIAREAGAECVIICDTAHVFEKAGAKTVIVSQGSDRVRNHARRRRREFDYEWEKSLYR